jgi:hypothetical protein
VVPYTVTRKVARCVCRQEPVTVTQMVPRCVARQIPYEVCRIVPVQECCPTTCGYGCGWTPCGSCVSGACGTTVQPHEAGRPVPEPQPTPSEPIQPRQPSESTGPNVSPMPAPGDKDA